MFVACPGCQRTVPGEQPRCQFCGAALAAVSPKTKASIWHDPDALPSEAYRRPDWIPLVYNIVAGYIAFSGVLQILVSALAMRRGDDGAVIGIIAGAISLLLGVGLLLRIEIVRGIVNFVCGISLLFGLFGLATSIPLLLLGGWGILIVLNQVLSIVSNGAMIYLVGETD